MLSYLKYFVQSEKPEEPHKSPNSDECKICTFLFKKKFNANGEYCQQINNVEKPQEKFFLVRT